MAINGVAVGITAAGAVFLYSGISGKGVLSSLQYIVQGKSPASVQSAPSGLDTQNAYQTQDTLLNPNSGVQNDSSSAQAALQAAATVFGWGSGAQWTALNAIEMQEAGYNPTATNPSSGAYGMAQSLGHSYSGGPASNGVNEYGGYTLTAAQSEAASLGNPVYQSIWMCDYIQQRYGSPVVAEQFHLANGYY